jgi:Glutathione peroxidase
VKIDSKKGGRAMGPIYNFRETEMNGGIINFRDYQGKVLLIVNTASKCGLAPQLESIEKLYNKYRAQGLEVLGLPSNQFHQELDSDEETSDFCQMHYGVTFPMTRKVIVNGLDEDPLFTYLKDQSGKGRIKWNFTKFLIDKEGNLLKRFAPITKPEKMESLIIDALKK